MTSLAMRFAIWFALVLAVFLSGCASPTRHEASAVQGPFAVMARLGLKLVQ